MWMLLIFTLMDGSIETEAFEFTSQERCEAAAEAYSGFGPFGVHHYTACVVK